MKKFKLVVSVVFCLTIEAIGMSSFSTNESQNKIKSKTSVANSKSESFKEFYKFFYSGSFNQISRIKFPLKSIRPSMRYLNEYDTIFLTKKDWYYLKTEFEVIKSRIEYVSKSKAVIVYYGIDPPNFKGKELFLGLHTEYIFKLRNGKWYLIEIVDTST
jgi:hypothetical protein